MAEAKSQRRPDTPPEARSPGRPDAPLEPEDAGIPANLTDEIGGRKSEILAAALRVFASKGYSAGSMREIASEVGVSEPALYRHYTGKEALFVALLRAVGGRLRSEALELVGRLRPHGLRDQIAEVLADRRSAMRQIVPALRMILTAASHEPLFLEEYRAAMIRPVRARLEEKAAELDRAYGIDRSDAERADRVRALMALMVGYLLTSVVLEDRPDEAIADAVLRVMGWEDA